MGDRPEASRDPGDEFRYLRCIALLKAAGCTLDRATRWLDLGCHQGQLLELLTARFGIVRPLGADDWPESLRVGQTSPWNYVQADLEKALPRSEPMDVISALEVLEHITDTDRFLSEICDRLKPGGWLLLSTPNINSLRNRLTVPFGAYPTGLEYRNIIHHVRLYNPHVLRTHLASKGLSEIRMRGVSFLPMRFPALGRSSLSRGLADLFPQLCNNFIAAARKPPASVFSSLQAA
jgi:2-polyprenyl-3-methyl-5-hydroxy-6-metoxy-1,4-benzoquinol methylase